MSTQQQTKKVSGSIGSAGVSLGSALAITIRRKVINIFLQLGS